MKTAYTLRDNDDTLVIHPLRSGRWAVYVNGELRSVESSVEVAARVLGRCMARHRWRSTRSGAGNPLLWAS